MKLSGEALVGKSGYGIDVDVLKSVAREIGELKERLSVAIHETLADALPEILDDPTERADRLWNRLGRQVDRLGETAPKRGG